VNSVPSIDFPDGLVGFDGPQRFVLVRWGGDDSPFSLLRSVADDDLAFVVVPPAAFFADYELEIDDDTADRIGLTSGDDALVLVIVSIPGDVQDATANLLGPLVVNMQNLTGVQAVLNPDRWPTRRPLLPKKVASVA
jgi:flagellar assembly factor FliW